MVLNFNSTGEFGEKMFGAAGSQVAGANGAIQLNHSSNGAAVMQGGKKNQRSQRSKKNQRGGKKNQRSKKSQRSKKNQRGGK
jgi:hypothetical protein